MSHHTCDARCPEIIRRYLAGEPMTHVGFHTGTTAARVRDVLVEHNIPRRPRGVKPMTAAWIPEAIALHNMGATLREIGDKVGVTRERVRQILVAHGLFVRNGFGHHCNEICPVLLAEPKRDGRVRLLRFARRHGFTYGRVLTAAAAHNIRGHAHTCDERCAKMEAALASGLSVLAAKLQAGFPKNYPTMYTQFPIYHPEWNWPTRRIVSRGRRRTKP